MSEVETRRKHRYYRLGGVIFVAGLLISGSRARIAEEPIELMVGWDSVATLCCLSTMLMILAVRMIWHSLRELRIASRRRERLIAISTLSLGLMGVVTAVQEAALQIFDQLGWTHTAEYRQQSHASRLLRDIGRVRDRRCPLR